MEFNSRKNSLVHQYGRRLFVLQTKMAAVTSYENAILFIRPVDISNHHKANKHCQDITTSQQTRPYDLRYQFYSRYSKVTPSDTMW